MSDADLTRSFTQVPNLTSGASATGPDPDDAPSGFWRARRMVLETLHRAEEGRAKAAEEEAKRGVQYDG